MDEAFACWVLLIFLAFWRLLLKNKLVRKKVDSFERRVIDRADLFKYLRQQNMDHHFARGSFIFEWWFFAWLAIFSVALRTFWDVFVHEYLGYHYLLSSRVYDIDEVLKRNFERLTHDNATMVTTFDNRTLSFLELREEFAIPNWLKSVSMAAPVVGIVAVCFFSVHLWKLTMSIKDQKVREVECNSNQSEASSLFMVDTKVMVEVPGEQGRPATVRPATVDAVTPEDPLLFYKVRFDKVNNEGEPGPVAECCQWARDVKDLFIPPPEVDNIENLEEQEREADWKPRHAIRAIRDDRNPWVADDDEDLILLVIMMPAAFIIMSMRALIRVLEVMTASALSATTVVWSDYEAPLIGTYITDLELCSTCQYFTVWAFACLCIRFFNLDVLKKSHISRARTIEAYANEHLNPTQREHVLKPGGKSYQAFAAEVEKKSREHHRALSIAGLLGVWGYLFVGLCRCLFGMYVAVNMESKHFYVRSLNVAVLAKVQPVFLFSMVLCVANMFIVLKMDDLMKPEAFGKNANLKFTACRALLIIGDMQIQVLDNMPISPYQAKLLHASLLMFECFGVIVFNSVMWNFTSRMRQTEAHANATGKRGKSAAEPTLFSKLTDNKDIVLHAVVGPWVAMFCVLTLATVHRRLLAAPPEAPQVLLFTLLNKAFASVGPCFVLFVMVPRCSWLLPDLTNVLRPGGHGSQFSFLPKGWVTGAFTVVLVITVVRLILFVSIHPFHDYISDHICLAMSIIAAMQMEIAVGHVAWKRTNSTAGVVVLALAWFVILLLALNSWVTAMYYHTVLATWVGFFSSAAIFGGIVVWWLGFMLAPLSDGRDSFLAPLVPDA